MKNNIRILLISFCTLCTFANAQDSKIDLNSHLSGSVGLISFMDKSQPGIMSTGTGTLILKAVDSVSGYLYLITNEHVLPKFAQNDSIVFRIRNFSTRSKSFFEFKIGIFDSKGKYLDHVKVGKNGVDVAAINLSGIIRQNVFDSVRTVPFYWLATKDRVSKSAANIGGEVFYIGYPTVLYDSRNINPILRAGHISTVPSEDFYFNLDYRGNVFQKYKVLIPEKFDGFLIDGNVLHGSSGSLVFFNAWREVAFVDNKGAISTNILETRRIMILGILSNSYFDLGDGPKANIGGVISAEYIIEIINEFAH